MPETRHLDIITREVEAINQCRLYLQAYYVSDLATALGRSLSYHAWEGIPRENGHTNQYGWPEQGRLSKSSWDTWRKFLKATILSRGTRLKKDLGYWIRKDHDIWPWYYCPNLDGLIQIKPGNEIYLHGRSNMHRLQNTFSSEGQQIN
jgi:hypothetical protein